MTEKKYIITEKLRIALLEYLATKPLKEVFEGWVALRDLQPMAEEQQMNDPLSGPKELS